MKRIFLRERLCLCYRTLYKSPPRRLISTRITPSSSSSISDEAADGFPDTQQELYPGVPLFDLVRGWTLYNMFRCDYVVDNSIQIMKQMESTIGRPLTENLLRASVFGHFGGEDTAEELGRKVEALAQRNIGVLFAYTSEQLDHDLSVKSSSDEYREIVEAKCNKVSHHYLKSIDHAAHYTKGRPPIIAIKLTAIVDYSILDRLTRILNYSDKVFMSQSDQTCDESHLFMDRHVSCANISFESEAVQEMVRNLADKSSTEGKLDIVDWQNHFTVENIDQLHLLLEEQLLGVERPAPLTHQEHEQLNNLLKRLNDIGERAGTRNVRVLIDAEQTYYQPAIRNMSLHYLMKKYNTEHPVIYDTIQSYLKSSYRTLLMGHATAQRNNNAYAIKLVRGAYMDEEGRLAQEQGYENPIHPNKDATDASYHKNIDYLLSNTVHTFVASHNNESTKLAKKKMSTYDISPLSGQVVFGQLLGMADYVSSPLAHDGYLVYKLLPYGVVREVVPYLARRAQENRGAMKSAQIERELLGKEIRQRLLLVFSGR